MFHVTLVSSWNWDTSAEAKKGHYSLASHAIDYLRKITPDAAYVVRFHVTTPLYVEADMWNSQNEADVYEPNHEGQLPLS